MKRITREAPNILRYGALHYAQERLQDQDIMRATLEQDLESSGFTWNDLQQSTLVLDFRFEGQCDRVIGPLIQYLQSIPVGQVAVIFNAVVDVSKLDYPAVCVPEAVGDIGGWFSAIKHMPVNLDCDSDFVCLVRRANPGRARLVSAILQAGFRARVSFGGASPGPLLEREYGDLFPGRKLPILLDGPLLRESADNREHDVTSPLIQRCAVNIIAESSSQSGTEWKSWFITEKTLKTFGLRQFPIWWAVPGFVSQVREQGWDCFDDILDHSYDDIQDEDNRLGAVLQEIQRLSTMDLSRLRRQQHQRLQNNFDILQAKIKAINDSSDIYQRMGLL